MESQLKLGQLFGVRLGLHSNWFIIAILIACSLSEHFSSVHADWGNTVISATATITALLFFFGLALHELAHALVARARKLQVQQITLFALGGTTQTELEANDPQTEFLIAIAGPIASLCIGAFLLWIAQLSGWAPDANPRTPVLSILVWLGYINLALAAFNMIPGLPLDGGHILRAVLWRNSGDIKNSTRIAANAGQIVGFAFILCGIYYFFTNSGFIGLWLAFIGWFLWQAANAGYAQMQAESLLRDLHVADLMSHECISVDSRLSLQQFMNEQMTQTGERCFVVSENGTAAGIITAHDIRTIERERWTTTRLQEAMQPMEKVLSTTPETSALHAMDVMAHEHVTQLTVISDGHVDGVISEGSIIHAIHSHPELAEAA